jgi:hypothetical protein
MLAIAGGIVLAVIILVNLEAIFALGLAAVMIAIAAAILIAIGAFAFDSSENLMFVTLIFFSGYIYYSYTSKSDKRETFFKTNRVPEKLLDLVKSNLGAKDLAIKWSTKDYEKEIKLDGFIIEFKQLTKNEKTGFQINVYKMKGSYERTFICALHSRDVKPRTFFITSSTLVFGDIKSKNSILLSVTSFCDMNDLEEFVAAIKEVDIDLV